VFRSGAKAPLILFVRAIWSRDWTYQPFTVASVMRDAGAGLIEVATKEGAETVHLRRPKIP